jgi:hypothetical protein
MNLMHLSVSTFTTNSPSNSFAISIQASPICIWHFLLNFYDIPEAIFRFSTMYNRAEWSDIQLDTWINAAWQLSFIWGHVAHWPLLLRLVRHYCLPVC